MVKEIDNVPYKERPWGTAMIRSIINTKQRFGMGNFTMNDLSEELNKGVINKFERKKVAINHIDEIHSGDLVDMTKYSRMNKGYKSIFERFIQLGKHVKNSNKYKHNRSFRMNSFYRYKSIFYKYRHIFKISMGFPYEIKNYQRNKTLFPKDI